MTVPAVVFAMVWLLLAVCWRSDKSWFQMAMVISHIWLATFMILKELS